MKNKEKVSVMPQMDALFENFSHRTYENSYEAKCELVDNSIHAILKKYQDLPELDKGSFIGHVRLSFNKKGEEISVFDNGCGMNRETIPDCVALGRSGFRADGKISKFGAGATASALSLSKEGAEIWFTSSVGGEYVSMQGGPNGTNANFEATVFRGEEATQGSRSQRLMEFMQDTSSDSGTLVTSSPARQKGYTGSTMERQIVFRNSAIFQELPFPIKFDVFGTTFTSTDEEVKNADPLVHPNHDMTFFVGGPNFKYQDFPFQGKKYFIRCSAALGYNHSDDSDYWQMTTNGSKYNQPQMVYHKYNGRIISARSDGSGYFKTHGTKRSFALEVMTNEFTEDFRTNPEKTQEIVSEDLKKAIEEYIKPHLKKVVDYYYDFSNRKLDRNERLRENLESASSAILRSQRKNSHSLLGGKGDSGKRDSVQSSKKGENTSYVGKSSTLTADEVDNVKRRSDVRFEAFHDSKDVDLIYDILPEQEEGKIIFRVNTAVPIFRFPIFVSAYKS